MRLFGLPALLAASVFAAPGDYPEADAAPESSGKALRSPGAVDWDIGFRGSIGEETYKLGLGGQLGVIYGSGAHSDLGLHLNYSYFRPKHIQTTMREYGGFITWYRVPHLKDQPFQMRLGPHVGVAFFQSDDFNRWFVDLGGDLMIVFEANPNFHYYLCFSPAYQLAVPSVSLSQTMFRVGFGVEFR